MMAASVWSLIIPAVEMSQNLGRFAFFPMLCGLWAGVIFLILGELFSSSEIGKDSLFFFAVILHNIPEGMAVGVAFATAISQNSSALLMSAMMLSVGVTIQNIPEGAIISMPLNEKGSPRIKAFANGALSGLPEPVFAFLTLIFSSVSVAVLPYLLGFAAGAMIYVSVKDLIPSAKGKKGCLSFLLGFSVMMVLDVALG
jgi:ZIP family zinc transporter